VSHRLQNLIALVTGASRGIGAAVAKRFAAEGAHVILVARTIGGLEEVDDEIRAAGGKSTLVQLDLRDGAQIDGLAAPLLERFGRLDVLVGNAGLLGHLTPLAQHSPQLWEDVYKVNVHANWRLIRATDPLLRASDSGRVLFVTSGITKRTIAYWGAYASSKAALESMARTYAAEMETTTVRVNLINPGPTRTRMREAAFPGEDPDSLTPPEALTDAFVALAEPACTLNGQWIAADEWIAAQKAVKQ
jgi:NAD(P)-dependent dehydrogenase (short-subunit alcohol dehydrogenase family)